MAPAACNRRCASIPARAVWKRWDTVSAMLGELTRLHDGLARRREAAGAGPDYGVGDVPDWRTVD